MVYTIYMHNAYALHIQLHTYTHVSIHTYIYLYLYYMYIAHTMYIHIRDDNPPCLCFIRARS